MTITGRDRRALILMAMAVPVIVIYYFTSNDAPAVVAPVASQDSIPAVEQRLARLRQSVARVPGKEAVLKQVSDELAVREKNLIQADTAAQATDQLLQIVRAVARAQAPPIELRGIEMGQPKAYGDAYGEVTVSINTECRMEQLLNMMSDLSARKELVSSHDIRIAAANQKEKTVTIRLTIAALVPKRLVPVRKESF
jgi:hypothetical protein